MRRHHFQIRVSPTKENLEKRLIEAGINLNAKQLEQLWAYHNLMRKRNQDRDLTRLVGFESIVEKHYIDCLYPAKLTQFTAPMVDIGTGAGFPGIPLKILFPHLPIILAEPRPRRVAFLNEAIALLKLPQVEVFDHKVTSQSFTKPVKGVITRALETIDTTILRTSGSLEIGGRFYFLKGPNVDEEIEFALNRFSGKIRLVADKHYRLPGTDFDRRLVEFEKLEATA